MALAPAACGPLHPEVGITTWGYSSSVAWQSCSRASWSCISSSFFSEMICAGVFPSLPHSSLNTYGPEAGERGRERSQWADSMNPSCVGLTHRGLSLLKHLGVKPLCRACRHTRSLPKLNCSPRTEQEASPQTGPSCWPTPTTQQGGARGGVRRSLTGLLLAGVRGRGPALSCPLN